MVIDARAEARGHTADRPLQPGIVECHQPAALLTDEVVVVLPTREHALEARLVLVDRDALDEPVLDQQIENPVDAGPPGPAALGAKRVLDLDRAERTILAREQIDDPLARAAPAQAGVPEDGVYMVAPGQCESRQPLIASLAADPARR